MSAKAIWMIPGAKADRDADPPRHVVGAERIIDQPAAIGAEEAAELMAHEGEPMDHRLPSEPEHFGDQDRKRGPQGFETGHVCFFPRRRFKRP